MDQKISEKELRRYGRKVKILERMTLAFVVLIFWFLSKIRLTGVNPRLIDLMGGIGRLKFEFPENVKEILRNKRRKKGQEINISN